MRRAFFSQRWVMVCAAMVASLAPAFADEGGWNTVVNGPPITVKNRDRKGSNVKEVWAEGDIDAAPRDIQTAMMTPDRFNKFMPNVLGSRELGPPNADGSVYVYTQLSLPVVSNRDYVVQTWLDEGVKPDGTGNFKNHWVALPNMLPERRNFVRVRINDGSWEVTPIGDGSKSHAVYKFSFDPGGWVPGFVGEMGNKEAIVQTFRAVEGEAKRLAAERAKAAVNPAPAVVPDAGHALVK